MKLTYLDLRLGAARDMRNCKPDMQSKQTQPNQQKASAFDACLRECLILLKQNEWEQLTLDSCVEDDGSQPHGPHNYERTEGPQRKLALVLVEHLQQSLITIIYCIQVKVREGGCCREATLLVRTRRRMACGLLLEIS